MFLPLVSFTVKFICKTIQQCSVWGITQGRREKEQSYFRDAVEKHGNGRGQDKPLAIWSIDLSAWLKTCTVLLAQNVQTVLWSQL